MHCYHVYLAGPISGLTFADSEDWRGYVAERLPPHIQALSPLRAKDYLKSRGVLAGAYDEHPLSTAKGITTRDRFDVMRSDLVLFNLLGARQVSIGTVMEIAWADAFRKPSVVAIEPGNVHWHQMVEMCSGFMVPDLDQAIELVKAILT